jgi:transcriptional regulator with XRE-family HTH domain
MNQSELAAALGVSQSSVSRMEAGAWPIRRPIILSLDLLDLQRAAESEPDQAA